MTKIVVTHLTRMHRGAVCVAGLETQTGRHVRPVLLERPLWLSDTAIRGGLFDMASEIDLGPTRPVGAAPHVENHEFQYAQARQLGTTRSQRQATRLARRAV